MILKNAIITPDGTELKSENRHDYKTHQDQKTGKIYGVDGGYSYARYIGDINDCKIDFIEIKEPFIEDDLLIARDMIKWGTYGKDGKQPYKEIKISEMSNKHIQNIIKTQEHISKELKIIFKMELIYRENNQINIKD